MGKLPCLTVLVASSLLSVMGEFAVEIFAGSAVLTLGLMLSNVPVVKPWDAKFGERFNVLTEGQVILDMVRRKRLVLIHMATPCLASTFARRTRHSSTTCKKHETRVLVQAHTCERRVGAEEEWSQGGLPNRGRG